MAGRAMLEAYVHAGRIAAVVELVLGSEAAADLNQVKELGKSLAMHVVAMNPAYTSRHAVDGETLSKELAIAAAAHVPIDRFFQSMCMDEQPFVLDYSITVGAHISDVAKSVGCSIALGRIWRHSA